MIRWPTLHSLPFLFVGVLFALPVFMLTAFTFYDNVMHVSGGFFELSLLSFPAVMIARAILSPFPLPPGLQYFSEFALTGIIGTLLWFLIGWLLAHALAILYRWLVRN